MALNTYDVEVRRRMTEGGKVRIEIITKAHTVLLSFDLVGAQRMIRELEDAIYVDDPRPSATA